MKGKRKTADAGTSAGRAIAQKGLLMQRQYNTSITKKVVGILAVAVLLIAVYQIAMASNDGKMITCWALCKPKSHVEVHERPDKDSPVVGRLDPMDPFRTDGESKNGFIWCDVGESCGGWIYCGYVSTDEPEAVGERYVCVAKKQVACRRWIHGPQIAGRAGWLKNLQTVEVFFRTDSWCVTSRGYIQSEWLEVDPE